MKDFKVLGGYSPALIGNIKEDASCIFEGELSNME